MNVQPIRFGDPGHAATREIIARYERAAPSWAELIEPEGFEALRRQLATLEAIDQQYGSHARLELDDAPDLVASIVTALAQVEARRQRGPGVESADEMPEIVLGIALWAIRHEVEITVVEAIANALAVRSNRARNREELAAAFGLMQGVIAHVAARLAADLERSNPERPWRVLHVNLAITAIRTEDPALIDFAFDALDRALPEERSGFYAEALALALSPGIDAEVRNRIRDRHLKWTA